MSIICSTLTWLRANVERQFKFQNEEKLGIIVNFLNLA
jgi:hypothetical protein